MVHSNGLQGARTTLRYRLASCVALLGIATVALGGSVSPVRAGILNMTPSVADQIRLGAQASAEIEQKYHVLHDSRAAHLVQLGDRLVAALGKDRGPWQWQFHLIDSSEVNAFAVPGGNVFFFTGLYDRIHDDNALAAVVGHEMTHVRAQHWARAQAAAQERQLGLMVLLGLAHANSAWQTVAGLGESLYSLKYSRGEEEQADVGGLHNMAAAGYDPCGMIELFRILKSASHGGTPEFLSDHPLTDHRIVAARREIRKMGYHCSG